MQTFITSDTHFGHEFMAKFRGFDSVDEHDAFIIRSINKRVKGQRLFILGDIAMGGWHANASKVRLIEAAEVHIILGNHDRPFPGNKNAFSHLAAFTYITRAASVQNFATLDIGGVKHMLSHFPYDDFDAQGEEERFEEFRLRDMGVPIIHGHTHSNQPVSYSSAGTKQYHVGLDAHDFKPVLAEALNS